jgi:predicted dinucleotide-utilizing enzyme
LRPVISGEKKERKKERKKSVLYFQRTLLLVRKFTLSSVNLSQPISIIVYIVYSEQIIADPSENSRKILIALRKSFKKLELARE